MNENLKRKLLLSLATMTTVSSMCSASVFAFGVHEGGYKEYISNVQNESGYQDWYNNTWNNKEEFDSGKVILTPGKTEKDLNFAWYSKVAGTPQVKMSKSQDMSNATVFEGKAQSINKTNDFDTDAEYYKASNKVSVDNYLEENTTYYYQYSVDGSTWSDTYTYQTHSFTNFQAILVGDPQIGASGSTGEKSNEDQNIANDTYSWNKTLTQAMKTAPDASFILSAGDQIDYSEVTNDNSAADKERYIIKEQEYAGYLYPQYLRSIPVATTIGNHESKGDDYKLHYNNPNASALGSTNAGGNYYYSYGDALIISLNSNSRNVAQHKAFLEEAISSYEDAKWRIVMFHHDIYGAGAPHANTDGANLRILFAPLMDEFDIDVCLTGHDHSYARTFQILDGKVITTEGVGEDAASTAYNPEGTLYITAGSATGSKFYALSTDKQYYLAERSNNPIPTFSTIDFTSDSFTIKTYDVNGDKYANDVTIKKDKKATSIEELKADLQSMDKVDMTSGSKQRIEEALNGLSTTLETVDDSVAINDLASRWNTNNDPLDYYARAKDTDYRDPNNTDALKQGYSKFLDKTFYEADKNAAVDEATIDQVYTNMLTAKSEVVTKAEYADLQAQFDEAGKFLSTIEIGNKKGQYTQENVNAYKQALAQLKTQMNESKITKTELTSLLDSLKQEQTELQSLVNKEDITPVPPVNPDENNQNNNQNQQETDKDQTPSQTTDQSGDENNQNNNQNQQETNKDQTPSQTTDQSGKSDQIVQTSNSATSKDAVKTEDTANVLGLTLLAVGSLAGIVSYKVYRKKETE